MLKLDTYGKFKPIGKNEFKSQIILCHTSREVGDYLTSLKFRYNKKYDKIPHYVITKEGNVLRLLKDDDYSNFFGVEKVDKQSIFVCLENLGWIEKKPLTNHYITWNGTIYKGKVFEKKWRDYFFWDIYNDEQILKTAELCSMLCEKKQIEKRCVGHNTKIDGMEKFVGVSSRSNFDTRFTDLSPAFNFENFLKYFENEQFTQQQI